jgi:two-component system alkaline phosphatase synthesis response regulator PhoP
MFLKYGGKFKRAFFIQDFKKPNVSRRTTMKEGKILIVDDDPDVTEAMKIALETQKYQVFTAKNSPEAKTELKKNKPHLIILDVIMDSMSEGFNFCRELKKDPKYQKIPILMITSVKERSGIDFKPEAGDESWLPVDEFLDKPVTPDVLLQKVKMLLGPSE